jgi:hypothetical protein
MIITIKCWLTTILCGLTTLLLTHTNKSQHTDSLRGSKESHIHISRRVTLATLP